MANAFLYGTGGGAGLNFKVVGGTSAPASPAENTIWVNTGTAITGWVFCTDQPAGAEGKVWIVTGKASNVRFNALKKNDIQVYPISAKQYIGGSWVSKTAKSYQGGTWVDWLVWSGELYIDGKLYEPYTGDFISIGGKYQEYGTPVEGTIVKNADNLHLSTTGSSVFYFANKIDLTNYITLKFDGSYSNQNYDWVGIGIWSELTDGGDFMANRVAQNYAADDIDVSALNGEYYIGFWIYFNDYTITVNHLELK